MRSSLAILLLGAALAVSTVCMGHAPPASGSQAAASPAPAKARAKAAGTEQLPDWSGVWELDWQRMGLAATRGSGAQPKLTPAYQARTDAYRAAQKKGENEQTDTANCVPPGMPQIMTQPYPVEFLFTPGKLTVAIEAYSQMRRIYMDGRKHPEDPDPTYQGHSIAHWEGDTLVVDSVGFIPESYIAPGVNHSDKMRIVEHIRRVSPDAMTIETTIIDPEALAEPWTVSRAYRRHADWELKEYICNQNNRDSADAQGRAGINISR
jgi:hypothetical protein